MVRQGNNINIVVVGGINADYLVRGEKLPGPGETVLGELFKRAPGGKGSNQAVAAARLGGRVALVGKLGADARGDELLETLDAEGIHPEYLLRTDEAQTGAAVIMVEEGGEKAIMVAPGANHKLTPEDVRSAQTVIEEAEVVLTQAEIPIECVMEVARIASGSDARLLLDPARPEALPDDLLRLTDIIKPNASEAQALTDITVNDRDSAREAAHRLLQRGVSVVAVQAGGEGNLLVWQEDELFLPELPVDSVDATGAGDAFAAALAVALAEGWPLEEAGRFANAAAALATTALGAQAALPTREAVMDLLEEHPQG